MPGVTDAALQALFAPYCGGVSRGGELTEALQILQRGELWGRRPVQGGLAGKAGRGRRAWKEEEEDGNDNAIDDL